MGKRARPNSRLPSPSRQHFVLQAQTSENSRIPGNLGTVDDLMEVVVESWRSREQRERSASKRRRDETTRGDEGRRGGKEGAS